MRIEIHELELLFVLVIYAKYKENRIEIDGVFMPVVEQQKAALPENVTLNDSISFCDFYCNFCCLFCFVFKPCSNHMDERP